MSEFQKVMLQPGEESLDVEDLLDSVESTTDGDPQANTTSDNSDEKSTLPHQKFLDKHETDAKTTTSESEQQTTPPSIALSPASVKPEPKESPVVPQLPSNSLLRKNEMNLDNFEITVKFPIKHGEGRKAYASYTIETKVVQQGQFKSTFMSVQRRYSQFSWLRHYLNRRVPGRIIPPVPPKHEFTMNKFDAEFLETRRAGLERFLRRIVAHSVLSYNPAVIAFLELKAHEFEIFVKENPSETGRESLAASLQLLASSLPQERESRFVEEQQRQIELEKGMKLITDSMSKVFRAISEEQTLAKEFAVSFRALAESDEDLRIGCEIAAEVYDNTVDECAILLNKLKQNAVRPLEDFALYPRAVLDALQWRDLQEAKRQKLEDALSSKHQELKVIQESEQKSTFGTLLGRNPEEVKQQKIAKLTEQLHQLTEDVDKAVDQEAVANEILKAELERQQEVQDYELREMISAWGKHEIERYSQIQDGWAAAEASLEVHLHNLPALAE
eukprot:gene1239-4448_t